MKICMENIWAQKKLFPRELRGVKFKDCSEPCDQTRCIVDGDLFEQDLWVTLHLVLGRLIYNRFAAQANCMKSPREAVPEELWLYVRQEVGLFPSRVNQLIKALSGTQFPSFQELLEIFCGGSLLQACSACNTIMTVAAVLGEAKGSFSGTPSVGLMPYMPPLFYCGAIACVGKIEDKRGAVYKWMRGCGATYVKLKPTRL